MDMFDSRSAHPMLLSEEKSPFDSPDYIYELKLDGGRCLAYVEPGTVDLRNKRGIALISVFPELREIWRQVNGRCILDGELVVLADGQPDFERLKSREMLTNPMRVELAARRYPASFVAFDIMYRDGDDLTARPLMERKTILSNAVTDGARLAVSRYVEQGGADLFRLTEEQGLEGIVAKKKDSPYVLGKRSRNWIKIKNLIDEDFIACGYIQKDHGMISLVLGRGQGGEIAYQGHVTLGVTMDKLKRYPTGGPFPFSVAPLGNEGAVWFRPPLPACTVTYMERTSAGGMRQPRLKSID